MSEFDTLKSLVYRINITVRDVSVSRHWFNTMDEAKQFIYNYTVTQGNYFDRWTIKTTDRLKPNRKPILISARNSKTKIIYAT